MSFHALAWALDQLDGKKELDTGHRVLLLILAHCHNHETGQCNPSVSYLAKYSGLSDRTVQYKLTDLAQRGIIGVKRYQSESGQWSRNNYILMGQSQDVEGGGAAAAPGGGAADAPGGADGLHQGGAMGLHQGGAAGCTTNEPESNRNRTGREKRAKRAPTKVLIPEGWNPNEADAAYAAGKGFSPDQTKLLAENFADHHRKKGTMWADWSAAWRTWVRNEIKFHGKPRQPEKPRGRFDTLWDPAL